MDLLIKNGTVITSKEGRQADILVKNGKIEAVEDKITDVEIGIKEIDASNMLVMPGGVDAHTHLDMPFMGTYSSDDFRTGTIAAAFGGTTSIIDYVVPKKGESLKRAVNTWHKKARGKAVIDYGFHVSITPPIDKAIKEIGLLAEMGITSIKCFLAYKNSLMLNDADLFRLLKAAKEHNILVCVHAENGEIINYLQKELLRKGMTQPQYHAYSRPPELEEEAVARTLKIAKMTEMPVYFVHLSTKGAIKEVKRAKEKGQKVFAETCPQYMLLNEDKYFAAGFEGAKYVMSPPLRDYEHCKYAKKALKEGFFDVIATDHCPFTFNKQKQRGLKDFTKIPNGIPGIETRMPLMFNEMVVKMGLPPSKFVELNCTRPAKIFGLTEKGDIKKGKDADIAIWNPDLIWKIRQDDLHENVDYTAFEGMVVTGKPITVISRGEIIVENGELRTDLSGESVFGHGEYINRAK